MIGVIDTEGDCAEWTFPAVPGSVRTARHSVRDALHTWGIDSGVGDLTVLLVSELVTNSLRYASGPIGVRLVRPLPDGDGDGYGGSDGGGSASPAGVPSAGPSHTSSRTLSGTLTDGLSGGLSEGISSGISLDARPSTPPGLLVEVSDPLPDAPTERSAGPDDESGRGLQLVACSARRWGTRRGKSGKTVWFELALPG
ncbi:ATP-binding protein [Streptomyces sp. NPDC088729]|uniref:ATP-binding protein n=1 Tax=Streptomyces sp. NPDC088729 TaxID=3365876 RepID=UPI003812BA20